ncbi:MAG: response regulator [Elusimicrobia bacterium]|nr:response regulator [Elusimicrobiota bacterium]
MDELEGAAPLRVLLAEDSESIAVLLEFFLSRSGLRVDVVGDGAAACERFAQDVYDVVVLDMRMPVLDGYGAAQKIRAIEAARGPSRVPIIALTANLGAEEARRSMDSGCTAHLGKPFAKEDLLAMIRQSARPSAAPAPASGVPAAETVRVDPEIADLVRDFMGRLRREAAALHEALGRGDYADAAERAHKLTGASGSFGFPKASEFARGLERAARKGDGPAALDLLRQLDAYLDGLRLSDG